MNAKSPSKVYNAQLIIGTEAWNKISRVVDHVFAKIQKAKDDEGEGSTAKDWRVGLLGERGYRPHSITALLQSIDPSKKGSMYRIKVTFFLFLAIRFYAKFQQKGWSMRGYSSVDDCITTLRVPQEVGTRLFELFTSEMEGGAANTRGSSGAGGYIIPKPEKDKLNAYVLILYIIASGNEMKVSSLNQLCKDIKLDVKDASLVLREAGFVVKSAGRSSGGDVGASLSVPLKFPPPKRGKRS